MQRSALFFVFLAVICIQVSHQTFEGVWNDDIEGGYGGYLYICVNGDIANGLYSEYGMMVGTISNDVFSGNFYEGGKNCNTGTFVLQLSTNANSFTGNYTCDYNGYVGVWNSTKLSDQQPTDKECAKTATSTVDATALWLNSNTTSLNRLDFCQNAGTYEVSYRSNTTMPSYGKGDVYESGAVSCGIFYTQNFDGSLPGASIFYVDLNGDLYHIYWTGLQKIHYDYVADPTYHTYTLFTESDRTTESDCRVNNYLTQQPYDYYPIYEYLYYDYYPNAGSQLTISMLFLALFIAFAML